MTDIGGAVPSPRRPVGDQAADRRLWWTTMLSGALLVVLGVWMLTNLVESVTFLAVLVGLSLIVGGFVEVAAADDAGLGWPAWLAGAVLVVAGATILVWPDITLWSLAVAAGAALVVTGTLRSIWAVGRPDSGPQLGLGLLTVAVGVVVLVWPGTTLLVIALFAGIRALVTGLVAIGIGWQLRRLTA